MRLLTLCFCAFTLAVAKFSSGPSPAKILEKFKKFKQHQSFLLEKATEGRTLLPTSISPKHYHLKIRPILHSDGSGEVGTAPGRLKIDIMVETATRTVTIHKDSSLKIETVLLTNENGKAEDISVVQYTNNATIEIITTGNLTPGITYHVSMAFVTHLSTNGSGIRLLTFENNGHQSSRMSISGYSSDWARFAFPCFDNPQFRSAFSVSIGRKSSQEGYASLSNAALAHKSVPDDELEDWVWDVYHTTPPMSTYFLAIVVAPLLAIQAAEGLYHKPVSAFGVPGFIDGKGAQFAVDVTARLLKSLEKNLKVPYALPKMDALVVHGAGGFDSKWGEILCRDDITVKTEEEKQTELLFLAAASAQQWFAGLVNCKYWSHVWLNYGPSFHVAYETLYEEFPEYMEEEFRWILQQHTLMYDADSDSPVLDTRYPLDTVPSDGEILLFKSTAIIRMIQGFLSKETLMRGLQKYLETASYSSVEQDDLWAALDEVNRDRGGGSLGNKTMKQVMDTWTLQPNYPLIRVYRNGSDSIRVTQEKYTSASANTSTRQSTIGEPLRWEVPIPIITNASSTLEPKFWISQDQNEAFYSIETGNWIVINPGGYGYYRVLYDDHFATLIEKQLKCNRSSLGPLARSQLVFDYWVFENHGHASLLRLLGMSAGLENERSPFVWGLTLSCWERLYHLFWHLDLPIIQAHLAPGLDATLNEISWSQDPTDQGSYVWYRPGLMMTACELYSAGCVLHSHKILLKWQQDPNVNPVAAELEDVIYCAIVANGGHEAFQFMFDRFKNASQNDNPTWMKFLKALSCPTEPHVVQRLLNLSISDSTMIVRGGSVDVLTAASKRPRSRSLVLDYVLRRSTLEKILEITADPHEFVRIISSLCESLTRREDLELIMNFAESSQELQGPGVKRRLNEAYDVAESNLAWIKAHFVDARNWLYENTGTSTNSNLQ